MPVVTLSYSRLLRLVSAPGVTKKRILEILPYLGLDIESDDSKSVRVEYSPNRPDYSTDMGIAAGLQGLLGTRTGCVPLGITDGTKKYQIHTTRAVSKVRPMLTGIVAKGRRLDEETIRQLFVMQEDLHFGLGRGRKKAAIGLHDLEQIGGFPLTYTTRSAGHKFTPLGEEKAMSASEILARTKAGRAYAGLLKDTASRVPMILDAAGSTISMPPIINSELTSVTAGTKDILVEITGTSKHVVENVLGVVAFTLKEAGFSLESVGITGGRNSTPELALRTQSITPEDVRGRIGIAMTRDEITSCLKQARLEPVSTTSRPIECRIPPHRSDIIGPIDLVEEVALGYGTWKIKPVLSPPRTLGVASPTSSTMRTVDRAMIGLGYLEALNSSLSSMRVLYEMARRRPPRIGPIAMTDSKSSEHTILRDSLLPGLVENLSRNVHEQYPQRLYEVGTVFQKSRKDCARPISEEMHLAGVSAHTDSGFTEAKSALQSMLGVEFGFEIRTEAAAHHMFEDGRCARIYGRGRASIGHVGQINHEITTSYRIRVPVSGFELSLSSSLLQDP